MYDFLFSNTFMGLCLSQGFITPVRVSPESTFVHEAFLNLVLGTKHETIISLRRGEA